MIMVVIGTDKVSRLPVLIGVFNTPDQSVVLDADMQATQTKISTHVSNTIMLDNYENIRYVPVDKIVDVV